MPRIYLDNAATSWPKPESVYESVDRYQRECGASAGRSVYREASRAQRLVEQTRAAAAQFLGAGEVRRVAFTLNGTDGLNQAIHGIVRPGEHVVTSIAEHNSVLRPLRWLEANAGVKVTRVDTDEQGYVDPQEILQSVGPETRLVVLTHGSNVTGAVQRVSEIGETLQQTGTLLLVDVAQTLGHWPVSVKQLGCDLLAAPGHKGLLAPLGTGLLYVGPRAEGCLHSTRQGGTGTQSEDDRQPESLPERMEAGSLNLAGIAGLEASLAFLAERGIDQIVQHGRELTELLLVRLARISGVTLFGPTAAECRLPVVSFQVRGYDPQEVAAMLDGSAQVQARAGLHCAPLMHRRLGTLGTGGTVRFSLGPFNTEADIETAVAAVAALAETA
jgi:cysteine desulfurase family protein